MPVLSCPFSTRFLALSAVGTALAFAPLEPAFAQQESDAQTPADASTEDVSTGDVPSGTTTAPPTNEPTLRGEDGVSALTPEQRRRLVNAPGEVTPTGLHVRRFVLPPYVQERGPNYELHALFPFYYDLHDHNERRSFVFPYYRSRTPTAEFDALFPFYYRLRTHEANGERLNLDVLPPFWFQSSTGPGRAHAMSVGLAPLFSYNETFGSNGRLQREHLVIPAALTFHYWTPTWQSTVVGPVVYFRNRREITWAALPFVVRHITPQEEWTLIPPLLTYHRYNRDTNSSFTVVGPFFAELGPEYTSFNLAPVFFHAHTRVWSRTSILPLFHMETGPERFVLITPLGGYTREGRESTVITPIYQNHRGTTDIDAVLPLFFYSRTPRLNAHTLAIPPLGIFHSESPTGYAWGVFPFVARFHEYGRYDTTATLLFVHSENRQTRSNLTWVFPNIHVENTPDGGLFNVYPFFFSAHGRTWRHVVAFPFFYHVEDIERGNRVTVAFPFYARVSSRTGFTQWVFPNHFYWQSLEGEQFSFGWDFFPFVQYGERRGVGHYWSVLEGLVGYRHFNDYEEWRIFYVPFGGRRTNPAVRPQVQRQANGDRTLVL